MCNRSAAARKDDVDQPASNAVDPTSRDRQPVAPTATAQARLERRLAELAATAHLSPRQTTILRLLVLGLTNKEIAASARCSEVTVEAHMTALLRRTRAEGRGMLVARFWLEQT